MGLANSSSAHRVKVDPVALAAVLGLGFVGDN